MRIELEVRTAVIILVTVLLAITLGGAIVAEFSSLEDDQSPHVDQTVELDDGSELWPYTSRSTSFDQRTLSINLVIYGHTNYTEYILRDAPFSAWEEVPEDREDIAPAEGHDLNESTTLGWGGAHGSDRYIWIHPAGGDGPIWLGESYQLENGDYLGERQHIRAYNDPVNSEWTAIQAHDEHWDWFHLRHTVHSIEDTQSAVEGELANRWYIHDYYRAHFENDLSSDADGWVTIIHLDEEALPLVFGALILMIGGVTTAHRDLRGFFQSEPAVLAGLRATMLSTILVLAYLGIRFGAIAVERSMVALEPKVIVVMFYPLLVIGMPIIAYLAARRLDATLAFWAATVGFVAAILIDYTYLGVFRLPVETFIHRFALAIAIGLIAAGASQTARYPGEFRGYVRTGVLLWLVAISLPLLQFI